MSSSSSDDKSNIKPAPTLKKILTKSAESAVRGGTAGAVAMGANVAALMWMRTTVRFVRVVSYNNNILSTVFHSIYFYVSRRPIHRTLLILPLLFLFSISFTQSRSSSLSSSLSLSTHTISTRSIINIGTGGPFEVPSPIYTVMVVFHVFIVVSYRP